MELLAGHRPLTALPWGCLHVSGDTGGRTLAAIYSIPYYVVRTQCSARVRRVGLSPLTTMVLWYPERFFLYLEIATSEWRRGRIYDDRIVITMTVIVAIGWSGKESCRWAYLVYIRYSKYSSTKPNQARPMPWPMHRSTTPRRCSFSSAAQTRSYYSAFLFHNGIRVLSEPVEDKRKLSPMFKGTLVICGVIFWFLGYVVANLFGDSVEQSANFTGMAISEVLGTLVDMHGKEPHFGLKPYPFSSLSFQL